MRSSRSVLLVAALALVASGCGPPGDGEAADPIDSAAVESAVRQLLDDQVEAWNRGDIEGFMAGYLEGEELRFVSGAEVRRGFEEALDRYLATYPDRAAMGALTFDDLRVRVLAPDAALVSGAWRLKRAEDEPNGRFTLLLREFPEGWRIVYDHTSSSS